MSQYHAEQEQNCNIPPTLNDIYEAKEVIKDHINQTLLDESNFIRESCNAKRVLLKTENVQKTGSFKIRGALNKLSHLREEQKERGIIAASAGNHAQGVALAAKKLNIKPCTIFMPENAPKAKQKATESYGAKTELHGNTYDKAASFARKQAKDENKEYIEAFNDRYVIAGQGTIGLEILEQASKILEPGSNVDTILVPVGGGGLISGIAIAVKEQRPEINVIGVQAAQCAAARAAWNEMEPVLLSQGETIADGIKVRKIGQIPFEIMHKYLGKYRYVDQIITVDEMQIIRAMFLLQERCKFVVEGAGAVGVAALLHLDSFPEQKSFFVEKNVVVVLSGGNVDMDKVGNMIETALIQEWRTAVFKINMKDKPNSLLALLENVNKSQANIRHITQTHILRRWANPELELILTLETRDQIHASDVFSKLKSVEDVSDIEFIRAPFLLE
ncbi:threonine ammonia-lyase [Dictyobacter formicarum]|uniref:L-threonine dehydratase catabolic TdcB n=1 Tax=Dictyobacter formicarum TaxID=2778368 RepID=A0ABQ3VGE7_9CHLR|nr:threonine ammonia-lyase [Dictyobacter formicarum]GHO85235.1 threonine ammonia-lyase [Dictyobacter formicarum]